MSRIFISHSSHDNAQALALGQWLTDNGWTDFFLDIHADNGIAAGERWLQAFMNAVSRCEAVLFLLSPAWCRSAYCTTELAHAKLLGKRIFGLIVGAVEWSDLPVAITADWQVCDLTREDDRVEFWVSRTPIVSPTAVRFGRAALDDLARGLRKAGLDARSFAWPPQEDPKREPYRGLDALQEIDAGVYFGRDAAIVQAIDRVRLMRSRGTEKVFVVLGASGAGKSSFLRAGLLPRLRREAEHFIVLPVVRPEGAPISGPQGLLASLRAAERDDLQRSTMAEVERRLAEHGLAGVLGGLSIPLVAAGMPAPTILLPIDQAEELFAPDGQAESRSLLAHLKALHDDTSRNVRVIVLCTVRSDAWPQLQLTPWLKAATPVLFSLAPIPQTEFKLIIEGPALRHTQTQRPVTIHPELSQRLVAESVGPDALPLLALTLQWLYRHFERHGGVELGVQQYEQLGSVRAVIDAAVERAFKSPGSDPPVPDDPAQLQRLLRSMFSLLATVDADAGDARRRITTWAEIRAIGPQADAVVRRLVQQRLLRSDLQAEAPAPLAPTLAIGEPTPVHGSDPVAGRPRVEIVEVAHEALLRQWSLLADWLLEHTLQLQRLERLARAAGAWANAEGARSTRLIHRGEELDLAEALAAEPVLGRRMTAGMCEYLRACRDDVERQRLDREAQQRLVATAQAKTAKLQRRAAWGLGLGSVGLAVLLAAAVIQTRRQHESSALAESRELARQVGANPNLQAKLELAIRAAELAPTEAAISALMEALKASMGDLDRNGRYAVDPGGHYVAVAAAQGLGAFMDIQSGRTTALCGRPEPIDKLSFSPDGRHLLVGRERHFKAESPEFLYQTRYEFEVWNTQAGRAMGNVVAADGSAASMSHWAPDSSALILTKFGGGQVTLVTIGADSVPSASRNLGFRGAEDITFSADRPLLLIGDGELSLWNLAGEPLGSTERVDVEWKSLSKGGSALVVALKPSYLKFPNMADPQVELFDIDAQGRLVKPGKVFDAAGFDWSILKGAALRTSVEAPVLRVGPNRSRQALPCKSATTDFKIGVGVCVLENAAPVLFDASSRQAVGELLNWTFGVAGSDFWFSPDGRTLLLAGSAGRVTAWDVPTRTLKWNLPGIPTLNTRYSTDGKRLLLSSNIDASARIVDAETGATLASLPGSDDGVVWIDAAGRHAISEERGSHGIRLTLWNVESKDEQRAMRSLELDSGESTEYAQDSNALSKSPSSDTLLQMARRRLRRCS